MTFISDDQVRQFNEVGFFLTAPSFDQHILDQAAAEFDRLQVDNIAQIEKSGADALTIEMTRLRPFIGQAHTRSAVLTEFIKAPIYLEACAKFIGADADLYYNQAVIKPSGKGKSFGWHQDSGYRITKPLEYITCWTAISRTFVENGCIWVIPGSHKWGLLEHRINQQTREKEAVFPSDAAAIPVEMLPGQVAIFSSLMLHKSGPNTSGEIRRGYVPQYHYPGVIGADNGQLWGDQFPVLRAGKRVG